MFGIGGRSFTKTIASDLDITEDEAEKLKLHVGDSKIKPSVDKEMSLSIDKTLDVWISGVELALSEFDSVDHLPNRILLCGGGASLAPLVDALAERPWYKELPFTKRPVVKLIRPVDVLGVTDKTGAVDDHTYITAMGLLRVGYDTLSVSDGDSVRDRISRMLRV